MTRRSGDGVRIGGGRLRVDAARAVTKLRQYQLPDPTLWTLEVVRAAVLFGATAIHLEADGDDVWLGWSGPALPASDLTRLFDDLVGSGGDRRAHRLLATGVNTALGLSPRFVDVWSIEPGRASRVRYAPYLLRASDDGHSEALRALVAEAVPRPEALTTLTTGAIVHARRALDLETIGRFLRGNVPPEVPRVAQDASGLAIPLHVFPRSPETAAPLLRVPIGEGRKVASSLRGYVEILPVEATSGGAELEWSELGVLLCRQPLVLDATALGARIPIVVRLDFDRLPTNAARSAIRQGEVVIEEGVVEAKRLAAMSVGLLVEAIVAARETEDHVRLTALRRAAIAILRAVVTGRRWMTWVQKQKKNSDAPDWFTPLLEVPLLRDALGRPRSLNELAAGGAKAVYRGTHPLRQELARWVGDVPWIPVGDPVYALYEETEPPDDAAELIGHAERRAAARLRFLDRQADDLRFPPGSADLALVTFTQRADAEASAPTWLPSDALDIAGLTGRVAIGAVSASGVATTAQRAEVGLVVHGRVIESIRVPCELPIRAMVTASTLAPNHEYTGLMDGDRVPAVLRSVLWAAVRAVERVAGTLGAPAPPADAALVLADGEALASARRDELEATVRAAQRLALRLTHEQGSGPALLRALVATDGPLARAPVFRPWKSPPLALAELQAVAAEQGVVGTVPLGADRDGSGAEVHRAPPVVGRLLVPSSAVDAEALPLLLASRMRPPDPGGEERADPPVEKPEGPRGKKGKSKKKPNLRSAAGSRRIDTHLHVVSYGIEQLTRARGGTEHLVRTLGPALVIMTHEEPGLRAALGVMPAGTPSEIVFSHAGRNIGARHRFADDDVTVPLVLVTDDDALIPRPDYADVVQNDRLESDAYRVAPWVARLAAGITGHLLGEAPAGLRARVSSTTLLWMLAALHQRFPDTVAAPELERLAQLAILPRFGAAPAPWVFFRLAGAGVVGFVEPDALPPIHAPLNGLEAIALSGDIVKALGSLFGAPIVDRTGDAKDRIAALRRAELWKAFFARPTERDAELPQGAVSVSGQDILSGWAKASRLGRLRLSCSQRWVGEHLGVDGFPGLEVAIDVGPALLDIESMQLNETGTSRVAGAVREARRQLLLDAARNRPTELESHPDVIALAEEFLAKLPKKASAPMRELLDALLDAPAFPALHGARISVRSALRPEEGEVFLAQGIDGWLPPQPGTRPHALDRAPVLAFPEPLAADLEAWVRLVRRLASHLGKPKDVTKEARRLREGRRVAQHSSAAPRLPPWIDRAFAVPIPLLAQRSGEADLLLEALPQGEAALVGDGQSRLVLLSAEGETVLNYAFVPAVLIVARSPYAGESREPEAALRLEEAVKTVVAEALRYTADQVPFEKWSPSIVKAVRGAALLGGASHLDRLATVPLFQTTGGSAVSFAELRAQTNRFGALWVVSDPNLTLAPLDPLRFALILAQHEIGQLHHVLPTKNGEPELRLDDETRKNLARPPLGTLEPTASERAISLGARHIRLDEGEAWVLPLTPDYAHERRLETSRGRVPLGPVKDASPWPTLARLDSTALTPNRVHDAPSDDRALAAMRDRISETSEAIIDEVLERMVDGRALSFVYDGANSRATLGARGSVRGVLHWSGVSAEAIGVRVRDTEGAQTVALQATAPKALVPTVLPLTGDLWFAETSYGQLVSSVRETLARRAYLAMLFDAGKRWQSAEHAPEERELCLAALVQAAISGHLRGVQADGKEVELAFLRGRHRSLEAMRGRVEERAPVFSLTEVEVEAAARELPKDALLLVKDGSLPSELSHILLAPRIQSLREWMMRRNEPAAPAGKGPKPKETGSGAASQGKPGKKAPTKTATPRRAPEEEASAEARAARVFAARISVIAQAIDAEVPPVEVRPRRPLVRSGRELTLAAADPALRALLAAPSAWTEALPCLAAEALTLRAGGVDEGELTRCARLLTWLAKEAGDAET